MHALFGREYFEATKRTQLSVAVVPESSQSLLAELETVTQLEEKGYREQAKQLYEKCMQCAAKFEQQGNTIEAEKIYCALTEKSYEFVDKGMADAAKDICQVFGQLSPSDYIEKAADLGFKRAQYWMGFRCFYGTLGVEINVSRSFEYVKKSVDQGHLPAKEFLPVIQRLMGNYAASELL